jgi:DNA-binding CsgD family transcriptional regulator
MINLKQYDSVIHSIYEASLQPDRWQLVMVQMAELFGASRGQMFTWTRRPSDGGFVFAHNIPPQSLALWDEKNRDDDPLVKVGMERGLMIEGSAYNSTDLIPDEQMFTTNYYKRQWEPIDIARVCSGIIFDGTDSLKLPTLISLGQGKEATPFDRHHADTMRRLLRHFARSLGVMYHLRDRDLRTAVTLSALDRLNRAVLVLDANRHVVVANHHAQSMISKGTPLTVDRSGRVELSAEFSSSSALFDVECAATKLPIPDDVLRHYTEALCIQDGDGSYKFVMHIAPLTKNHGFAKGGGEQHTIIVVYDLAKAAFVNAATLEAAYDLSPSEALAATQLLRGGSIAEMASRLGIGPNTFKSQLQAAFLKTGTHRQVDMLKLLHGMSLQMD